MVVEVGEIGWLVGEASSCGAAGGVDGGSGIRAFQVEWVTLGVRMAKKKENGW